MPNNNLIINLHVKNFRIYPINPCGCKRPARIIPKRIGLATKSGFRFVGY
jgi:hypothetical protein